MYRKVMKANAARKTRRANRTRACMQGTATVPRLSVFRSLKHISAQLIDDVSATTLASASDKEVSTEGKPVEIAKLVGQKMAEKAKGKGITAVVFDRGSFRYHGRVAALAAGAREAGLNF